MNLPDRYTGPGINGAPSLALRTEPTEGASNDRLDVRGFINMFRRRMLLFSLIIVNFVVLAILITLMLPVYYSTEADVVMNSKLPPVTPSGPSSTPITISEAEPTVNGMATQIGIIQSVHMAEQVIKDLKLEQDKDFVKHAVPANPFQKVLGWFHVHLPDAQHTPEQRKRLMIDYLISGEKIQQTSTSFVISIVYGDNDPQRSAAIANQLAKNYTEEQKNVNEEQHRQAASLLESRISELQKQAQADYGAVQAYRVQHHLLSAVATQLSENDAGNYDAQLATARSDAADKQARYNAALGQSNRGLGGSDNALALESPVVQALRAQRATLSVKAADLSSRELEGHPDLIAVRQQLADIDRQINAEIRRTMSGLAAAAHAANERVGTMTAHRDAAISTLSTNNHDLVGLDDLNRRAGASQALYESYLSHFRDVAAQAGTEQNTARVISPAKALNIKQPSFPSMFLNVALGLILGILTGAISVIAAETTYEGLTTRDEVEDRIGLRFLGGIPLLSSIQPRGNDAPDTVTRFPESVFAEAFRNLLTSIRHSNNSRNQVVAITSALPNEGKTSIAICLARIAAAEGEKVIVIDCDVIRHRLSRMMNVDPTQPGLQDVLKKGAVLGSAMFKDEASEAMILPITGGPSDGERLMDQGSLHRLIAKLREHFTLIILDAAPILPIAETRELVALADNVVVSVLWRKTTDQVLRSALKLLPLRNIPDAGIVLNMIDVKKQVKFGYGDSLSFYEKYKTYLPSA